MNVSCIRVSTDLLIGKKQDKISNFLSKTFVMLGIPQTSYVTVQNNPNSVFDALNFSSTEWVFVLGEQSFNRNFAVKNAIAKHYFKDMKRSIEIEEVVKEYHRENNLPLSAEAENEFYLPSGAEALLSPHSPYSGFVLKLDNKTVVFMPDNEKSVKHIFDNHLVAKLQKELNTSYKTISLKTFGISENNIYSVLGDLVRNIHKILFLTYPDNLKVTLVLRYNQNLEQSIVSDMLKTVYERLGKYIYSDDESSLSDQALALLKLSNKTLSVVETITGGLVANKLFMKTNSNEHYLKESFVVSGAEGASKHLGYSLAVNQKFGFVSVETAYELAAACLEVSGSNYVVCTVGPNLQEENAEKLTSYIAVGDSDGIHVYKTSLSGNKKDIIESVSQSALFYLFKVLKQKGLLFSEIVI